MYDALFSKRQKNRHLIIACHFSRRYQQQAWTGSGA